MRLFYYLFQFLRKYYRIYVPRLQDWYWSQDRKIRHRIGWTLVLAGVCLVGICLWGVGIGVEYVWLRLGGARLEVTQQEKKADIDDDEPVCLDWYSGNYKHRTFKCGDMDPKRRILVYREFKDMNDVQLVAARRLGIPPISKREDLDKLKSRLVKLKDTRFYKIDPMTHSVPYLVPDAADFLSALGERWQQYHGTNSRFIITSCLRTDKDVKRLRRGNVNATKESCHRYGTTFDITYVRFDKHGRVRDHKLKDDLARALYDMKASGHCYVKYEYRQSCFHVTVRPR